MSANQIELIRKILFIACLLLCFTSFVSSAVALLGGIAFALFLSNPYKDITQKITSRLLAWSIIGLGAGMNLMSIYHVGLAGVGYTIIGIILTLTLGLALGKYLRSTHDTSWLISIGTAICGGSAIAAAAPVLNARSQDIAVALVIVFALNALALVVFPVVGGALDMTQNQFGLWSALAIHDTSSVVGATMQYGSESLEIGTTIKLARALWIIPVTMGLGIYMGRVKASAGATKPKYPWFILGFVLIAAVMTWVPNLQSFGDIIQMIAKRLLIVTLFLIGAGFSRDALKEVGLKPFLQGVILWIVVASASLSAILFGVIS